MANSCEPVSATVDGPLNAVNAALEAAGDAAYSWDLDGDRLEWTGRLAAAGIDSAICATGRLFASHIHPDDLVHRQLMLATHFDGAGGFDCEYRLRVGEGRFVWVHERGQAHRDSLGRAQKMLGVIRAIEDRKAQQTRLEQLANYDELTGHFNRSRLREAVDRIIAANQRGGRPAAFLSIGVDGMTMINNAYGRDAADTVLIEIGRRLDSCLRVSDLVGRLGGDRFGILLSHCPAEHIGVTAEKIRSAVHASPIATARGPVGATVSIGSAAFADHGTTSYDIITRAEAALAEAKDAGRDCCIHSRVPEESRERRRKGLAIGETVQTALRQGRLLFAFQPVVAAASGAVDYYECLLRMRDEDTRIVTAGAFVPAVEQFGLIRLVDRYVLDRAMDELATYPDIRLGFNISGLTAADRPWLRALISRLRHWPEIARRVVIEITETAALYDIEESARFVGALRRAGCRVALDDFGVGHTSLRHLQSLAFDTVKIDGSFIRNLDTSPDSQVFLRHLLGLAEGFGFTTVAESVETAEEAAILRREGIGFLQGSYCGRPSLDRPWLRSHPRSPTSPTGAGMRSADAQAAADD